VLSVNASPYHRGKRAEREGWAAHHARTSGVWIAYLNQVGGQDEVVFDGDSFVEQDAELAPCDPLEFVSTKDIYAQKLKDNQERTGLNDALISGRGTIAGHALVLPPG
jgi:predicted amidohydrolase